MKYFIVTYGCQMQKADSERIALVLEKTGYKKAPSERDADLNVVNMCSIRQSAVDRVYGLAQKLKKLKEKNKKIKTVLTGCITKKDRKSLTKYFDYVLNIKDLAKWPQQLQYPRPTLRDIDNLQSYLEIQPEHQNTFMVFIPISTGCNNHCSYCVVPYTRGPLVCRDHRNILEEIKRAVQNGAKEIWLLGQNVNDYYSPADISINFAELLKMVNNIPGNFWIRFTSPHPKDFSDELIETMAKYEKVTPYLNLPAQSGDNEILKKMRRPYTVEQYKKLVKKIREAFKKYRKNLESEVAISTDIIVGFPGETKKQFQNTVKLFKEIKFDMAYIAQYSSRPGTLAAKMKDNVSRQEKKRREKELTEILKKTALEKNEKYIGREVKALVNELRIKNNESRMLMGKSRHYKTVKIQDTRYKIQNTKLVGQFIKVKIIGASPWGLKGIAKLGKEKAASNGKVIHSNKLIVILGPTASGKSELAVRLAKKFKGEIVSADSRQIYKEMDIGTGKITKKEMGSIPHYLLDIIYPSEKFNVAIYKKLATKTINDIQKIGKLPFLVGGTGLHISAIVDNLEFPKVAPNKKLRQRLEKKDVKELFKIYEVLDSEGSKSVDKKNKRRLIRAIEVSKTTKKSFWEQRKKGKPSFDILEVGIKLPEEKLKKKIRERIEKMFKDGLEREARKLLNKYGINSPSLQTIGYQEWKEYFEKKINRPKLKENITIHTIQFMKRQMTWFKRDKKIHWIKDYKDAEKLIEEFTKKQKSS